MGVWFGSIVLFLLLTIQITMSMNPCEEDIPAISQIPPPRVPPKFQARLEYIVPQSFSNETATTGAEGTIIDVHYDRLAARIAVVSKTGQKAVRHLYDFTAGRKTVTDPEMTDPCSETELHFQDLTWLPLVQELYQDFNATHLFPPDVVLGMIDEELAGYMGKTEVRGIPADKWDYCFTPTRQQQLSTNISISVYWSEEYWIWPFKTPDSTRLPLGYEMRIVSTIQGASQTTRLSTEFLYNILFFRPDYVDEEMFKLPARVPCTGLQQSIRFPQLGQDSRVSMKMEMLTSGLPTIKWVDAWYDFSYSLVRLDYDPDLRPGSPQTHTTVLDLHEGAVFILDTDTDQCAVMALEMYQEDWASVASVSSLNNSNVEELFGVSKADYVYVGTRSVRNIENDVFQGVRTDWPAMAKGEPRTLWEWYFTKGNYTYEVTAGEMTVQERFFPTLLEITLLEDSQTPAGLWKKGITLSYQIYMFQGTPGGRTTTEEISAFDITMCFAETYKKHLQFELDVSAAPGFLESFVPKTTFFLEFWWKATVQKSGVSPVRVTQMQVINTGKNLYIQFKLLGRHPHLPADMILAMVTLQDAEKKLRATIDNGVILFPWETPDSMETSVKPKNGSLREVIQEPCSTSEPITVSSITTTKHTTSAQTTISMTTKSTKPAGHTSPKFSSSGEVTSTDYNPVLPSAVAQIARYSHGSMASIAVGMLVAGLAIGSASTFVVKRYVFAQR